MERAPKEILSRLGTDGLARTLDDLLDQKQLVRLASSCGLKYRGMRTQSQSRRRLLTDLVEKAGKTEAARKAILHALRKETVTAAREWADLGAEERARRLCDRDLLLSKGKLGLHLYLLAASTEREELEGMGHLLAHQHLLGIAANGDGAATGVTAREQARLKRRSAELEKKLRHVEGQLAKAREGEKGFKRDLIQRKGELAESRMLAERLRRELAGAKTAAEVATAKKHAPSPPDKTVSGLARTVRDLAAQQRQLVRAFEKGSPKESDAPAQRALAKFAEEVRALRRELDGQRRDQHKELATQVRRLEELRAEVRSRVAALGAAAKTARRARAKAEGQRVGVFIDVQNMYYGARQLKGKLDFDALMAAAVNDRRRIQATAYVVESKEIDQSQFIGLLQQRAIKVQRKALKVRADGSMKGDWDMELALDVLDAAPQLDVVVLVSGDGDFTSMVKRVKTMGPRVEVISFPRNTAKSLVEAADKFQPLDRKFMIYPKRSQGLRAATQPRKRTPAPAPKTESTPPTTKSAGSAPAPKTDPPGAPARSGGAVPAKS